MKTKSHISIEDKEKCCGCYSCFSICPKNAIEMIEDDTGFVYPFVDENKCIGCQLCIKVCVFKNL